MTYLEDWALLDRGYSSSLSGAIEALKASTLRLPVVSGAKVFFFLFASCSLLYSLKNNRYIVAVNIIF